MKPVKNILKSLAYKPLESLVGCAEYIHTLHSKSGHKKLFFFVMIFSSFMMLFFISDPLHLRSASVPSLPKFQFFSLSSKGNTEHPYDPLKLLEDIRTNRSDVIIIDVRSRADFDQGHIKNAIHVPVGKNGTQFPKNEDILSAVKAIKNISKDKEVILYGNFHGTSYVQELSHMLQKKRVSASTLAVGWNEWYHFRNLWMPESMWDTIDMDLYVQVND